MLSINEVSSAHTFRTLSGREVFVMQGQADFDLDTLTAACHSAACRPPTSGGTGGSLPMQHVTTSHAAAQILKSGFSLDGPSWNRAFGEGVYFAHDGDVKSAKFYARLGGRTAADAQIVHANVSLSNPLRITGNTVGAIRIDLVAKLGGPATIKAQAQAMYDRDAARARKILEEELKPDNPDAFSKLDPNPEDATFWDFSPAAYDRMEARLGKELETGNFNTLKSLRALTYDDVLKSVATSPSETYNGPYTAALGNIAKHLGHDGLIIESDKWGTVGGNQVVVFDLAKIQVTGIHPHLKPKGLTASGAEFACHDARCRPPSAGGTGGSLKARTLPDVPVASVKFAYRPRHPDGHADPGEIVWAHVPFEDDPSRGKDRPVLIVGRTESGNLVGVQLTSKTHHKGSIPIEWGSDKASHIRPERMIQVDASNYRKEGAYVRKPTFQDLVTQVTKFHKLEVPVITAAANPEVTGEDENPDFDWAPVHEEVQSIVARYQT